MIVSCPSCSTRTHLQPREAKGLADVMCRACGHRWTEVETIEAIDITERSSSRLPRLIDHEEAPEMEARRLAELAREAQAEFAAAKAQKARRLRNWSLFGAFVLSPFMAAALFPETIVAAAPISYKAYEALGLDVNIFGLDIRRVERQHAIVNGLRILTVKGEITNVDENTRKLPWLRFALTGPSGEELYSWTLDTGARPLRAGETTGFVTRVQAPPEAAQNLKIRFARASELGKDGAAAPPPLPLPAPPS